MPDPAVVNDPVTKWIDRGFWTLVVLALAAWGAWWSFLHARTAYRHYSCESQLRGHLAELDAREDATLDHCRFQSDSEGWCFIRSLKGDGYKTEAVPIDCSGHGGGPGGMISLKGD